MFIHGKIRMGQKIVQYISFLFNIPLYARINSSQSCNDVSWAKVHGSKPTSDLKNCNTIAVFHRVLFRSNPTIMIVTHKMTLQNWMNGRLPLIIATTVLSSSSSIRRIIVSFPSNNTHTTARINYRNERQQ